MEDVEKLIAKYKHKGVLIDTNLLLVYLIGTIDKNLIENFKRTTKYIKEDYDVLDAFISNFESIITTPNIMTEVNNLATCLSDSYKYRFYQIFHTLINKSEETYLASSTISIQDEFSVLGITDTGILSHFVKEYLLLTDDFTLSNYFASKSGDVINFNHIRAIAW